jgi:aminoglycoside phosphotransferase (APT) family kinase protein
LRSRHARLRRCPSATDEGCRRRAGCRRRRAAEDGGGRLRVVELIARGRDADVFALDSRRVLRRYRAGGDTAFEAAVMRHVAGHAYPVPRVHVAEGPDLILERVHGPALLEALVCGEVAVRTGAELLADLHVRLHAVPARPGAGQGVVHLDLHPDNVLLGPAGPVVIDWRNAADGPPELDLAVTALIMALVAGDPEHPMAGPAADLLSAFVHLAHGDVRCGLPGAVELRRVDPNLSADEKARLEAAAALVHAARAHEH